MRPTIRWASAALAGLLCASAPDTANAGSPEATDSVINDPDRRVALRLHGELGFLGVLDHRLQLGRQGTYVDLRRDVGQDTLFVFGRLSGDLDIGVARRHSIVFLYQPLDIRTQAITERDLQIEDATISAGTPINFRYGFPFWRASYLYDFLDGDREVAIGGGMQIRNARLEYSTGDGELLRASRNVGPVPLLKFRGRGFLRGNFWMGGEIDGFYAPIRFLNGGRTDVEGLIVDASLRAGLAWKRGVDTFLNVRYLAGGAQGTSSRPDPFSDGFNRNWLHFMTLSVGVSLR